jgi:HK97 gp10 family phage protein
MNLAELNKKLDAIAGGADAVIRLTVEQTAIQTAADARMLAPEPTESRNKIMTSQAMNGKGVGGGLRESITTQVEGSGGEITGKVICNAPHGAYVEFGTGPEGAANHSGISPEVHVTYTTKFYVKTGRNAGKSWGIDPKTGMPFWVYTPDAGKTFVRTSGQPARPFMYPAAKQNRGTFLDGMRANIAKLLRRK